MKPADYLDAAKARLNIASDYELAKRLLERPNNMTGYRTGDRNIPLNVAFKLAVILELDPAQVVADLESQREKNPDKRAFWDSFMSRAKSVAVLICVTLAFQFSAICGVQTNPTAGFLRRARNA